jgi:hypothetical protein
VIGAAGQLQLPTGFVEDLHTIFSYYTTRYSREKAVSHLLA